MDRKLRLRLNMNSHSISEYNWKDFWQSDIVPQDDDGHGTAMLSIVHRIAPFANVCVARIASNGEDLKEHPETTSSNLAKVFVPSMKL